MTIGQIAARRVRKRMAFAVVTVGAIFLGHVGTGAQGISPDSDPRQSPRSTVAPRGDVPSPVQFNELVRLGLLMMDSKQPVPPAELPTPTTNNTPWTQPYRTGPQGESPTVTPPPALGLGDGTVYAIGDSVLLGTDRWLGQVLGGWNLRLDAKVSRRFPEGLDILRQNQASVGQVVVICLGHNYGGGGSSYGYIDDIMALTSKAQRVVFITQVEWSRPQVEVNRAIRAAAERYPKIVVAPWAETIQANPQWLADHVHPTTAGAIALSNLIAIMVGPLPSVTGIPSPPPFILPVPDDTRPVITTSTTRVTTTTSKPTSTTNSTTTVPPSTTTVVETTSTSMAVTSTSAG